MCFGVCVRALFKVLFLCQKFCANLVRAIVAEFCLNIDGGVIAALYMCRRTFSACHYEFIWWLIFMCATTCVCWVRIGSGERAKKCEEPL